MSSMNNLSQDGEFRYILQWFNEWSELQRDDFVPVLVDYLTAAPTTAEGIHSNSIYMNGLVHAVNNTGVEDRPMSLFQCRIKLFRQWSIKWPQDFKVKLQQSIIDIDAKVGEKIINELKVETGVNGDSIVKAQTNGILSHTNSEDDEQQHVESIAINNNNNEENEIYNASTVMRAAQSIVDSTEAILNADTHVVSQLLNNNESFTPVADDIGLDNNSSSEIEIITTSTSTTTTTTAAVVVENSNNSEPAEPVLMAIIPEHVTTATLATAIPI